MNLFRNLKLLLIVTILPVIAIAIVGTTFFFKDRISFFSQAAADTVVEITPKTSNTAAKKNINVSVLLSTKKPVNSTKIVIKFDKTYLKVVGEPKIDAKKLGKIVKKSTAKEANATGTIIVQTKLAKKQTFAGGVLFTFVLRGKATTTNATNVTVDQTQSFLKTTKKGENVMDAAVIKNANYVIRAASSAPEPVCDELTVNPSFGNLPNLSATATMVGIPATKAKNLEYIFTIEGQEYSGAKKNLTHTFTTAGVFEISGVVKDGNQRSEKCSATIEVIDPTQTSHTVCVSNACTEVAGPGTDSCEEVGESCGDSTKHNECVNNACTQVAGAGTDQCTPVGISCGANSHNICVSDACVSVPGTGSSQCATPGSACGNANKHNECVNNACTEVDGAGADQCAPSGSTCGLTDSHNECINDACVRVAGAGSNQCTAIGQSCGSSTTHKECRNNSCTVVNGPGTDSCAVAGSTCSSSPSHKACLNNACTVVSGIGTDECQTPGATCTPPTARLICSSNACQPSTTATTDDPLCVGKTQGASCDTTPPPASGFLVCGTNNTCQLSTTATADSPTCANKVAGATCIEEGSGNNNGGDTTEEFYLACVNSACQKVIGVGTNRDGCIRPNATCKVAACPDKDNPSCQDCNGDGAINMVDFACFAKYFNQTL